MPIKEGTVKCANDSNHVMVAAEGNYALTTVKKVSEGNHEFKPDQGIILKVFFCNTCGYIQTYVDSKLRY